MHIRWSKRFLWMRGLHLRMRIWSGGVEIRSQAQILLLRFGTLVTLEIWTFPKVNPSSAFEIPVECPVKLSLWAAEENPFWLANQKERLHMSPTHVIWLVEFSRLLQFVRSSMSQSTGYFNNQLGRRLIIDNNTQVSSKKKQQQQQESPRAFVLSSASPRGRSKISSPFVSSNPARKNLRFFLVIYRSWN